MGFATVGECVVKYKFVQDDCCHWYKIPANLYPLFLQLDENGESDGYVEFESKFDGYRCDHPTHYTFENPE